MNNAIKENIKNACNRAWQTVATDIGQCCDYEDLSKESVIDIVLDSDYVSMYGKLNSEDLAVWQSLSHAEQEKLANEAFTHKYYMTAM